MNKRESVNRKILQMLLEGKITKAILKKKSVRKLISGGILLKMDLTAAIKYSFGGEPISKAEFEEFSKLASELGINDPINITLDLGKKLDK